jgi:hypothetical protein
VVLEDLEAPIVKSNRTRPWETGVFLFLLLTFYIKEAGMFLTEEDCDCGVCNYCNGMGDDTIIIGDGPEVLNIKILDPVKNNMMEDLSRSLDPINSEEIILLNNLKINSGIIKIAAKHKPNNPKLWAKCLTDARSRFRVCPSAYCNAFAAKTYKKKGGTWKTVKPKSRGK